MTHYFLIPGLKRNNSSEYKYSISYIAEVVCEYFRDSPDSIRTWRNSRERIDLSQLNPEMLRTTCRKREFVYPRQIIMYIAATRTSHHLTAIGNYFNGRDHTTVIHSRDTIRDLMCSSEHIRNEVLTLLEKFS